MSDQFNKVLCESVIHYETRKTRVRMRYLTDINQITRKLAFVLLSFTGCILIIYFAHLAPAAVKSSFSPLTCTRPPLECWDSQNKEIFGKCTKNTMETIVRGITIPAGSVNCYKSMYVNMDAGSFGIITVLVLWIQVMNLGFSNLFTAIQNKRLSTIALLGFIAQIPSVWYGAGTLMHYLNDHFFSFWYSQIWFSGTEVFTFIIASFALDQSFNDPFFINIAAGISLAHIIQLLVDEFTNMNRIGRNLFLLLGDGLVFAALVQRNSTYKLKFSMIGSITGVLLILFHLMFADDASTSF